MADKYALQLSGYKALWNAIDWVFPPKCVGCGAEGQQICPDCLQKIQYTSRNSCIYCGRSLPVRGICPRCRQHPPVYQEVRSLAGYEGVIHEIIINLKYKADLGLSLAAAGMLANLVQTENWQLDMVVPVPLNEKREVTDDTRIVMSLPTIRFLIEQGAKVIYLPAEWPTVRNENWRVLCQARAIENQLFICAVNCVGDFKGNPFYGHSLLIAPSGKILAEGTDEEQIVIADIDMQIFDKVRNSMSVFADRRSELYQL